MGLATVYGIVKQNNGFIDVHSEPGRGTTFTICLPRHARDVEAPGRSVPPPASRGRETILVVEDEPGILKVIRLQLEELGYVVLTAFSPGDAMGLAEAYTGTIHLLLTDVLIPDMNGGELAKTLMLRYPTLKGLFLSGYTADVIADQGVVNEGVSFLQKPFFQASLAAKIREVPDAEIKETARLARSE